SSSAWRECAAQRGNAKAKRLLPGRRFFRISLHSGLLGSSRGQELLEPDRRVANRIPVASGEARAAQVARASRISQWSRPRAWNLPRLAFRPDSDRVRRSTPGETRDPRLARAPAPRLRLGPRARQIRGPPAELSVWLDKDAS